MMTAALCLVAFGVGGAAGAVLFWREWQTTIRKASDLNARNTELRYALWLCYEHAKLYDPAIQQTNVGQAVRDVLQIK